MLPEKWMGKVVETSPVARARWGTCPSPVRGLCPITRPWGPSPLLTPSPIRIHDLVVFNIDICAIWHKTMRIFAKSRKFAQNHEILCIIATWIHYEFCRNGFIVSDIFILQGPIAKCCAPSLAIFWLRAWCCSSRKLIVFGHQVTGRDSASK